MNNLNWEIEILKALQFKDQRPSELLEKLYPKFKSAQKWRELAEETFRTQLNRKLKKLTKDEEVKRIVKGHQNVVYSISGEGRRKIMALEINSYISRLDDENLLVFRNIINRLREEQHDPGRYCFAFIGDVPVAFNKNEESFKAHLAQEKYLRNRHEREIERIKKEVEAAHPNTSISIWGKKVTERVESEVGWGLGTFYRGLLKKAENKNLLKKLEILAELTPEKIKAMEKEAIEAKSEDVL